jgi:hypothetical protein
VGLHLGSIGKIGPKAAAWWGKRASKKAAKKAAAKGAKPAGTLPKLLGALKKEAALSPALHKDVMGALRRMQTKDPSLKQVLEKAHGYAVFPGVARPPPSSAAHSASARSSREAGWSATRPSSR